MIAGELVPDVRRLSVSLGQAGSKRLRAARPGSGAPQLIDRRARVLETYRVQKRPDLRRIIIGVDPSGTKGSEDGGDHIGIVVVGLGLDGHAYVLEDCSVKASPATWGRVVVNAFDRHAADCVVAETNFGGAMVEAVIKTAAASAKLRVPFREVKASRGKVVRAEPIAALYDDGKIHHVGAFPALEDEMVSFTTLVFMGDGSPDRTDALIWGLTELFPRVIAGERSAEKVEVIGNPLLRSGRNGGCWW